MLERFRFLLQNAKNIQTRFWWIMILLRWYRFKNLSEARDALGLEPCVYVIANSKQRPMRVGRAAVGLKKRYWGGTGYALDAAMHGSGNSFFVAEVDKESCEAVERELIWRERESLVYNTMGTKSPPENRLQIRHIGKHPRFTRAAR